MSESEIKKCPKCGGEMREGKLRGAAGVYIRFDTSGSWLFPSYESFEGFMCQKCGFIEFYKEMKEKRE